MRTIVLCLMTLALVSFSVPDTSLTDQERKLGMDQLTNSKNHLLTAIKGLSPAQLNFKATPTSWSIAECTEHIAISESLLYGMVEDALKTPADPSRRGEVKMTDEQVIGMISSRDSKFKTAEPFEPTGKFGSHDGTVKEFLAKRDAHIAYVKSTKDDLRNRYAVRPFGTFDTFQAILFMAGHSERHTKQIEEVKADPNFPKK